MASRRRGRVFRTLALATLVALPLAACSSALSPSPEPAPTTGEPQSSQPDGKYSETQVEDYDAFESDDVKDAPSRGDNTTPRHDATPPRYEPEPLWPESGEIDFPATLGDFTHSSQTSRYSNSVTTIYTDYSYQILSVTVGEDFHGYNNRLESYSNLQYSGGAVCGSDNTQSNAEIAWMTCFMVGSDGYLAVTAYATSEINMSELAGYTDELYRALTAQAR